MQQLTEKTKREVVRAHIQDGRTLISLAAEYGVSKATVSNWVRNAKTTNLKSHSSS